MREVKIQFNHDRFGTLEACASSVLHFAGLPGFPEIERMIVMEHDQGSPFAWLVAIDAPELAFVVGDPRDFVPGYSPELSDQQLEAVGATREDELEVLCIVSVGKDGPTMNLAAPVVISRETRRGSQAILESGDLPIRHPLRPVAQTESNPQT